MGSRVSGNKVLKSGQLTIAGLIFFMLIGSLAAGSGKAKHDDAADQTAAPIVGGGGTASAGAAGANSQRAHVDRDFIIGPDDVLAVNVWREPEISQTVTVRPDGKISLPLAGEVVASGLTTGQLESTISRQLENYLSRPQVTVIVHEVKSQRVVVAGEVTKPGSYELQNPMTVLDALAEAGGPTEYAKVTRIYVLRVGADGGAVRIPFNYKQVIKGHNLAQNVKLEPHDTVVVP